MDVLAGDLGDVDEQDIEVAAPDQIEQQIQRALETLQHHLQRIGRNIEVGGQLHDALAEDDSQRQFLLLRRPGARFRVRLSGAHGVLW